MDKPGQLHSHRMNAPPTRREVLSAKARQCFEAPRYSEAPTGTAAMSPGFATSQQGTNMRRERKKVSMHGVRRKRMRVRRTRCIACSMVREDMRKGEKSKCERRAPEKKCHVEYGRSVEQGERKRGCMLDSRLDSDLGGLKRVL